MTVPVTPLDKPTSVHKFMVNITLALFAKLITDSSPENSSELMLAADLWKCNAFIVLLAY